MKPDFSKITAVTTGKTKTTGISPFSELEISKVYPNPEQPRKQFDDIEELAATIKEHGLLQPITVVKKDDGYMIISGERRYKAHLHNVAKTIKAHIIDVNDDEIEELSLIENIQRNDLTDFELAKHICKLWDSGRYAKKSDLAARIGKQDSFVSKSFNCLKLDSEIIDHIEQNKTPISIGVMDEIARVKNPTVQKEVFEKYNNGEITRDEIKEFKEPKNLKTEYFGNFYFTTHYYTIINLDHLLDLKLKEFWNINNNYSCIVERVNIEEEIFQDKKNKLVFTLKTNKKNLEALKGLGENWIKIANNLLENKTYRFSIELSKVQEEIKKEPINHTLKRFEDADNDLVEQAKVFSENFPRENKKNIESEKEGRTVIDEIVGFGKSIMSPNNELTYLPIENIGGFYLYNTGAGATKMFKKDVTYKLKIEEFNPNEKEQDETAALKQKIQELEKEIEELNNKEVFIVGYRENKGSATGGGFRCRALNENEAIEIAKKVRYSEIANDKNIIWEARTLKSSYNSENLFYDWVGYGFGTVNDRGTYISICQGDFKGTVLIRENGDFIKNTNDKEYRVIIKEN